MRGSNNCKYDYNSIKLNTMNDIYNTKIQQIKNEFKYYN